MDTHKDPLLHKKKPLLTADELISHMDKKGITFRHMDREAARDFLENHNYFFKLYSYRANYEKASAGKNRGKYLRLDFSYLQELSTLDCHFRYLIVEMSLTLEHALKVMLLRDIETNPDEDGYKVVASWDKAADGSSRISRIESQMRTSYCRDLIQKNHGYDYPVWVVCELIPFGDLCKLLQKYDRMYPRRLPFNTNLLFNVRNLRNGAAHSNCLIYNLHPAADGTNKSRNQGSVVYHKVSQIRQISPRTRTDRLANHQVYDFCTLLYLFFLVVRSEPIKRKAYYSLIHLFVHRMRRHRKYFEDNTLICSTYRFTIYAIRYFYYLNR